MASVDGPVLKMERPSFFYHHSTFTSFKMGKKKVSTTAQTGFFFSLLLFLSQDSMHRIIQIEYSISTRFTKIYMI